MVDNIISGELPSGGPDITISVRQTFGLESDMQVPAFSAGAFSSLAIASAIPTASSPS